MPRQHRKVEEQKAVIASYLEDGYSPTEIAERITLGERQIRNYREKLIEEGKLETRCTDQKLAELGRDLRLGRRYAPEEDKMAREMEDYFRKCGIPLRIEIAPTLQYDDNRQKQLNMLGQRAGHVLSEYLCHGPDEHTVANGLGKHMAAVAQKSKRPSQRNPHIKWLPVMGTYPDLQHFDANIISDELSKCFGGKVPIRLAQTGFVPTDAPDELINVYRSEESYVKLFGGTLKKDPDLDPSPRSSGRRVRGLIKDADTAIFGCGVAAKGNPLLETPRRFRRRKRLRDSCYPAVGDLNQNYLCVRPDGGEILLPSARHAENNPEAWHANERAIGADLHSIAEIAHRHQRTGRGGGVIVVANSADRAPLIYAAARSRLINTCILDYHCGVTLYRLLRNPDKVVSTVPEYCDW